MDTSIPAGLPISSGVTTTGPSAQEPAKNLGLRQIQRVVSLDVAARHVVSESEAKNVPLRPEHEGHLPLGDLRGGVGSQTDGSIRPYDARSRGL